MVSRRLGLRRIEVLQEACGEDVAAFPEEQALLVAQGEHPGQFRSDIAARPPVRPRDPARRQPRATNRWTARSICREETLQGGPREPAVATGRREHPNAAGIAPTAQGGRRDAEHVACFREADPLWVTGRRASHQTYSNLPEHCRLAHFTTRDATGSSTTAAAHCSAAVEVENARRVCPSRRTPFVVRGDAGPASHHVEQPKPRYLLYVHMADEASRVAVEYEHD